jgi:hypothetical protein
MTADGAIRRAPAAFRDYLTEVGRDLAGGMEARGGGALN